MSRIQIHYNLDNIDKQNANFNLIYGEKSNGKSYQVKHKKAIDPYIENHERFILMRRWADDLTSGWIEKYFSDVDIQKKTNKKYNCITMYRRELYFSILDENYKIKRGEKIRILNSHFIRTKIQFSKFFRCNKYNSRRIYVTFNIPCK